MGLMGYLECRCGAIHERVEDRYHHECLHDNDLISLGKVSDTELQVCCSQCGMAWIVDLSTEVKWDVKEGETILYTVDYDRSKA